MLLRKPRAYAEIYNDLDGDVVNLFSVLRSADAERLIAMLRLTPFARDEFEAARIFSDEPVEEARRLIVRSFMGFGSDSFNREVRTGFRSASNRSGTTPAHDWATYPAALMSIVERLQGVVIENRNAIDVMRQHDSSKTLHYLDPPYMHQTRSEKSRRKGGKYHAYKHELSEADHRVLLQAVKLLDGMVVVSGYPSELYDGELSKWRKVERIAHADGARPRLECLWINLAAELSLLRPDLWGARAA